MLSASLRRDRKPESLGPPHSLVSRGIEKPKAWGAPRHPVNLDLRSLGSEPRIRARLQPGPPARAVFACWGGCAFSWKGARDRGLRSCAVKRPKRSGLSPCVFLFCAPLRSGARSRPLLASIDRAGPVHARLWREWAESGAPFTHRLWREWAESAGPRLNGSHCPDRSSQGSRDLSLSG